MDKYKEGIKKREDEAKLAAAKEAAEKRRQKINSDIGKEEIFLEEQEPGDDANDREDTPKAKEPYYRFNVADNDEKFKDVEDDGPDNGEEEGDEEGPEEGDEEAEEEGGEEGEEGIDYLP